MLSLPDIPEIFFQPSHALDFFEWLRVLPIPDADRKAALFLWAKATNHQITSDNVRHVMMQDVP